MGDIELASHCHASWPDGETNHIPCADSDDLLRAYHTPSAEEKHWLERDESDVVESAVREVPFDVLQLIFHFACKSLKSQTRTAVIISSVYHFWRVTALSSPIIWSYISVYGPTQEALVQLYLERSSSVLLSINIEIRWLQLHHDSHYTCSQDALFRVRHRWKSAFLRMKKRDFIKLNKAIQRKQMPALEVLRITDDSSDLLEYLDLHDAPNLHTVSVPLPEPRSITVMPFPWAHICNLIIRPDNRARRDFDGQWDKVLSAIKPRTEVCSLTIAGVVSSEATFPTLFDLPPQFRFTCLIVAPEAWTPSLLTLLARASVPELLELIVVSNAPATVEWPLTVPKVSEVVDALASFVRNSASQLQNLTVTDVHIPAEHSWQHKSDLSPSSTSARAWNILPLLKAAPSLLRLTLNELQSHLITPELIERLKDASFLSSLSALELGWAPRTVRCSYSHTYYNASTVPDTLSSASSTHSTPNDPNMDSIYRSILNRFRSSLSDEVRQPAQYNIPSGESVAHAQYNLLSREIDDPPHEQTASSHSPSPSPRNEPGLGYYSDGPGQLYEDLCRESFSEILALRAAPGLGDCSNGPGQLYEDLCRESFSEILPLRAASGLSTIVLNTRDEDWAYPVFNNLVRDLRQRGVRASLA